MRETTDLYKALLADYQAGKNGVSVETRLRTGPADRQNYFATKAFDEDALISIKAVKRLFAEDTPSVGNCCSSEITIDMLYTPYIARRVKIIPEVRLTDGTRHSEWLEKGVFYIDTLRKKSEGSAVEILEISGYDALRFAERPYEDPYGMTHVDAVVGWCISLLHTDGILISLEANTKTILEDASRRGYRIPNAWNGYSCRELLGYAAAMLGGNFIMNDVGELQLVPLNSAPMITRYIADSAGSALSVGGVKIRV